MKHKKSRKRLPKVVAKTLVALIFSVFFLLPIVLTITNSFMSSTEISANYGKVFSSVDDTKGREYIGEKVNLKFIPDMVSFEQYWNVLLKSPDYLLKFWNSVLYVVPITVFQLVVASLAAYSFTRFSGKKKRQADGLSFYRLCIRLRAQPCWNASILYKHKHGTEYRQRSP